MKAGREADSNTVIDIRELTKDYEVGFLRKKRVRALDHLSLQVRAGEIFGFLGPNGAGKTTTLKLLMRLIYPTEGTAFILGESIGSVQTRQRIGYLPENPYFYDYLSGRELLHYTAALFGIQKQQARSRADQLLELVGLDSASADRQLRKYSKGMLQRIGIAQALVNDPEIVFLDEPMSGLDPIGRREIRDLILRLRQMQRTVFFSSHILSDVEMLCDRIAILNRGRLVRSGSVAELTLSSDSAVEIIASGLDQEAASRLARAHAFVEMTETPAGTQIVFRSGDDIEKIVFEIGESGGRVISLNPRRVSLEDIFAAGDGQSS